MEIMSLIIGLLLGMLILTAGGAIWWRTSGQPRQLAEKASYDAEFTNKRAEIEHSRLELEQDRLSIEKNRLQLEQNRRSAEIEAERLISKSRQEGEIETERLINKARREAQKILEEGEKHLESRSAELARAEGRIEGVRVNLEEQRKNVEKRDARSINRQNLIDKRELELTKFEQKQQEKLAEIAMLSKEAARQEMLDRAEQEARQDMARVMREVESRAREQAEVLARKHIATAIQRIANDHAGETTTANVIIPSEEMKGRIIGRNGRNIRAFEQVAGVDVLVDDTPEIVTISSFDPIRREVARRALEQLVVDGRIHPTRIEKMIKDITKEVEDVIMESGEQAAYETNVTGLHKEVLRMLGRLRFRTSYGQNQLFHSIEAAQIAGILAAEIGANIEIAKMGALLHDIGKAMDHNQEGTHALIGAEFLRRFKVNPIVINAVESHHHEVDQESVEAILVESADAISGSRPGARRESLENYIKRVRTLEEIATSFAGVEEAFALQAGREIRILVKPNEIDDLGAIHLSKEIAKTIEDSMQYPGQIQVTIIRETRATSLAK